MARWAINVWKRVMGHHCHTITTVPCILAMVECCLCLPLRYNVHWLAPSQYHVVIAHSLAIQCKNCIIVACSFQYNIKNTILVIVASCNRQFAITMSPLRPCDTIEKNVNVVASCNTTKIPSCKQRCNSPIVASGVARIAISSDCTSIGIIVKLIAISLDHVSMDVNGDFDSGFNGWFHLAVLGY
jgi:hypothetical protein